MSGGTIIGKNGRGNRAAHSKESILAHTKNLLKVLLPAIQRLLNDYDGDDKDYLRWLTMVLVHANPAAHCELRTPKRMWREHIEPSKSLLSKEPGEGAAIGRLIWQTAMGLYINDEVKWLNEDCGCTLCALSMIL